MKTSQIHLSICTKDTYDCVTIKGTFRPEDLLLTTRTLTGQSWRIIREKIQVKSSQSAHRLGSLSELIPLRFCLRLFPVNLQRRPWQKEASMATKVGGIAVGVNEPPTRFLTSTTASVSQKSLFCCYYSRTANNCYNLAIITRTWILIDQSAWLWSNSVSN